MIATVDLRHLLTEETNKLVAKFLAHVRAHHITPDGNYEGESYKYVNYKRLGIFPRTKLEMTWQNLAAWQVPGLNKGTAYILEDGSFHMPATELIFIPALWARDQTIARRTGERRISSLYEQDFFNEYSVSIGALEILHRVLVTWERSITNN